MRTRRPTVSVAAAACLASAAPVRAADHQAPTRPNPLKITAVSPYSVSLSWSASSDNSGSLSYLIQASNGYTMTVPQSSTAATFSTFLFPRNTYSFSVYAVDPSGNTSGSSNTVKATLGADTTAPAAPVVTVTDIGPTHVSLVWSAADNDPYLSYFVYLNGAQFGQSTPQHSGIVNMLQPNTTYTITVKARDHGINFSPLTSVTFTTDPINTGDTTAPTAPAPASAWHYPSDREINLTWTESTDNFDIQEAIRYEVFVNGALSENVTGVGSTITYGQFGHNVITIVAIDTAGNRSDPVTVETDI